MDNLEPDNLQPPEELKGLWLKQGGQTGDAEMIVAQVLRDAQSFRVRARRTDLLIIAAYVLLFPLSLLSVLIALDYFRAPLVAAGYAIWAAVLLYGLTAYRIFYRSLGGEPSPNDRARDYLERSIEYLNRRERFLMKSAAPVSALLAVAGIVFAVALSQGQDALFQVVVTFIGQPSVWATLALQRRYEKRRSELRRIVADLGGD